MAPRAYNNEARQQQQELLKTQIAAAAAELHAQKGALATSYAEIAERAGVSVPTVYKHYPDLDVLIRGCTGHVSSLAPPMPVDAILSSPDLTSAVEQLVAAMDRLHAYYEPWSAWREQGRIPVLAEQAEAAREQVTQLCATVLKAHGVAGELRELAAQWESLLHFDFWHRLLRFHKLTRTAVRRDLVHLLLAVIGRQPATDTPIRPTRRSS
jgi:AcrR family transcriptional regulator